MMFTVPPYCLQHARHNIKILYGISPKGPHHFFFGTAADKLPPVYAVYKTNYIVGNWCKGGQPGTSTSAHNPNCSKIPVSISLEPLLFHILENTMSICNLSLHFNIDIIDLCSQHIKFVMLPPNSNHLTENSIFLTPQKEPGDVHCMSVTTLPKDGLNGKR
jgi:hypothetical protein